MLTTGQTHEKPHRADRRRGGVVCGVLLSVFLLDECGHDIQGGSRGHAPLLPSLDSAPRYSAEIGKRLSGQPALVADRLDSGSVVHDAPVIREDDGLAVGRRAVVGRHSHGSIVAGLDVTDEIAAEASEHPPWATPTVSALAVGVDVDFSVALDDDLVVVGIFEEVFADLAVGDGVGGGHCLSSWSLASLPLTRSIYAIVRKSQQLFTQSCVFFQRAVFRPLNA